MSLRDQTDFGRLLREALGRVLERRFDNSAWLLTHDLQHDAGWADLGAWARWGWLNGEAASALVKGWLQSPGAGGHPMLALVLCMLDREFMAEVDRSFDDVD